MDALNLFKTIAMLCMYLNSVNPKNYSPAQPGELINFQGWIWVSTSTRRGDFKKLANCEAALTLDALK